MQEPRLCRKCQEPIPESRGPRAEDCGLPKCKSKAYRLQKKAEAEAMAAALAAKQSGEKESKSANGLEIPIPNRVPEQSPTPSAPSCESVGSAASVQEVRLQPGQQSIVLVCGCGARTTIQISHIMPDSIPVPIPLVTETTAEASLPSSVSRPSVTAESGTKLEVANRASETVASPVSETVASPVPPPVESPTPEMVASPAPETVASPDGSTSGQSATTSAPVVSIAVPEQPVALPPVVEVQAGGVDITAIVAPDRAKEAAGPASGNQLAGTGRKDTTLYVAPPKPKFQVVEVYFVRKKDGFVATWAEAKTAFGTLLPAYTTEVDWRGTGGFRLAAPNSEWRHQIESAVARGECQLPGLLIVNAARYGEFTVPNTTDIDRLRDLFGRGWKEFFAVYRG